MKKGIFGFGVLLFGLLLTSCQQNDSFNNLNYVGEVDDYITSDVYYYYITDIDKAYLKRSHPIYTIYSDEEHPYFGADSSDNYMPDVEESSLNDLCIAGDKYVITSEKTSVDEKDSYLVLPVGVDPEYQANFRWKLVGNIILCEKDEADIVKIPESLITRDENGYIQSVDTSDYQEFKAKDRSIKVYICLERVVLEERNVNGPKYADHKVCSLNEYNGELYASIQDNVVFAFYSYDPRSNNIQN